MVRRDRPNRPAPEPAAPRGPSSAWPAAIGLLVTARYFQPTEGAVFGETLWQAQLWLAAAALWCWFALRSGRFLIRWSLLDGFVWLLVLGHGLSMVPVFLEGGDRRAAVNIAWEWAGLAAMVFLVRQVFSGSGLRRPVNAFAAAMVAIAAFGVWQHHVDFPQTARRYDALRAEEARLSVSGAESERLSVVRRELASLGIPEDPASRRRWEDRLRFSSEPFGTFALANTLGGLLATALPLVVGLLLRRPRPAIAAGLAVAVAVLLYCLILTKSRTAWVGLVAGAVAAGGLHLLRGRVSRRTVALSAAGVGGLTVAVLLVLATGGLDRAVFSEAPRSLRFRLDYWAGALGVLSERPILGTGAGNFRSYYLQHRPEGASEAVAAPHNLFLDVWAAGGLLSLVALVGLLGYAAFRFASTRPGFVRDAEGNPPAAWGPFEWGVVASFPTLMAVAWLSAGEVAWLVPLGAVTVAALFLLIRSNGSGFSAVAAGAGCCALAVHLLGADGIEFPAVVQTLLLIVLTADPTREASPRGSGAIAAFGLFGVLCVGCLLTGTAPVLNAAALKDQAMALAERGDPAADRVLGEAEEADPLSTVPPALRADFATNRAAASGSSTDFETARRRWLAVLEQQPRDLNARRRLAELLLSRSAAGGDVSDAEAAADLLDEAARLSPTDSGLKGDFARAAAKAGRRDQSREAAAEALRLDDVNRAAGHADLIFADEARSELERLAAVGNGDDGP